MNTRFSLFGMHIKLCIYFYHKTGPHHNGQAGWRMKKANGPGDLSHKINTVLRMLNSAFNRNYFILVSFFSWLSGKSMDLAFCFV